MTFWEDPLVFIGNWFTGLLASLNLSAGLINVIINFIGVMIVATVVLVIFIFLTWLERKVAARFQDRIGPNRVGPFGLLQPIADALKMITKEDTTPAGADKIAYNIAPLLSVVSVLMMWAVIPFTATWYGTNLNVGILYIAAIGSFGVISVLMAGWSSNNKYALLGAFRAVAQLISYEVPLFLSMLIPVLLARSMGLNDIAMAQESVWFIILAPMAALLFFISSLAEIGRTPFDLLEAESEIVAGYHVEYSGMKFGMFQAGEFMHALTSAALMGLLFFGGWNGPFVDQVPILGLVYFFGKTGFFYFISMWIRSTLPRIRIDKMMALNWKFMVPVSIVMLMTVPILDYFVKDMGTTRTFAHLGLNVVLLLGTMEFARRSFNSSRVDRKRFESRPVAVPPEEAEEAAA